MARRRFRRAFPSFKKGKVTLLHRLTVNVFDILHLFSTQASGVPNSTTATKPGAK